MLPVLYQSNATEDAINKTHAVNDCAGGRALTTEDTEKAEGSRQWAVSNRKNRGLRFCDNGFLVFAHNLFSTPSRTVIKLHASGDYFPISGNHQMVSLVPAEFPAVLSKPVMF